MTTVSFQVARGALSTAFNDVTAGVAAPTTPNDIEVRIDVAGGRTKREVKEALDTIWNYLDSPLSSTALPL